ncbi:rac gtpase [Pelomyxa schiedti]|nr:rac gtpase [Pelomyxa schiedti]
MGDHFNMMMLGDSGVGKTCAILRLCPPSENYIPDIWEPPGKSTVVDGKVCYLELREGCGCEDYDRLRPLEYPVIDIFCLCFSIQCRPSFVNATTKWIREIRKFCPQIPVILVGMKSDLIGVISSQEQTNERGWGPQVKFEEGILEAKKMQAYGYIQCSAITQSGLELLANEAVRVCRFPVETASWLGFSWLSRTNTGETQQELSTDRTRKTVNTDLSVWTNLEPSIPRFGHAAVVIGPIMYILGGSNFYHLTQNCEVLRFDTVAEKWLPSMPLPVDFCGTVFPCAIAHLGSFFAFGGRSSRYSNQLLVGTPDRVEPYLHIKFISCGSSPPPRFGASTVSYGKNMVIFGGFDSVTSVPCNDIFSLSFSDFSWKTLEHTDPFPAPRYHHTSVLFKSTMIIYGGLGETGWLGDLWVIDLDKMSCVPLLTSGNAPPPMRGHAACVAQGSMFIFGCAQNSSVGKLFRLALHQYVWTEISVGGTPIGRDFHSMVCLKDRFLIIFGGQMRTSRAEDVLGDCCSLDIGPGTLVFDVLPEEIWKDILHYLTFAELIRVSRTCRTLHRIAKSEPLWTNAYNGDWGIPSVDGARIFWKNSTFINGKKPPPVESKAGFLNFLKFGNPAEQSVCFGPQCTVKMWDGSRKKMKNLLVGDAVETGDRCRAQVICIWRNVVSGPTGIITRRFDSNDTLEITPDHPILHNSKWVLPSALNIPTCNRDIPFLYNIVVKPESEATLTATATTVMAGGIICSTLGTPVPEPLFDPFWSSNQVIEWLHLRPDFPNVVTTPAPFL